MQPCIELIKGLDDQRRLTVAEYDRAQQLRFNDSKRPDWTRDVWEELPAVEELTERAQSKSRVRVTDPVAYAEQMRALVGLD